VSDDDGRVSAPHGADRAPGVDPAPFDRVLLAGCGLIGGSLALALRAVWPATRIEVLDPAADPQVREQFTLVSTPAAAEDADLIVLGAPVLENSRLLDALARHVDAATVVTDLGSTKAATVAHARRHPHLCFIGGHPMAGSAQSGFAHADAGLFVGRPWIFTPDTDGSASPQRVGAALARLTQLVCAIGAHPSVMGADEHDRLVAYVSHLPQVVSSALMGVIGQAVSADGLQFSGPGLLDTTRLAASAPALWLDILATNAGHVGAALDALRRHLPTGDALRAEPQRIRPLLQGGRQWRGTLEAHGPRRGAAVLHRPATRTFLEMRRADALMAVDFPGVDPQVRRLDAAPPSLYRYLYREVGRPWFWIERLDWSDARIAGHLQAPGIELWLLTVGGTPAGFFELHRTAHDVEIAYFGLLPEFIGRRLGPALLTVAARQAWQSGPARVWLHTCSLDHPAAIRNYQRIGFVRYREERYDAVIPLGRPPPG